MTVLENSSEVMKPKDDVSGTPNLAGPSPCHYEIPTADD